MILYSLSYYIKCIYFYSVLDGYILACIVFIVYVYTYYIVSLLCAYIVLIVDILYNVVVVVIIYTVYVLVI